MHCSHRPGVSLGIGARLAQCLRSLPFGEADSTAGLALPRTARHPGCSRTARVDQVLLIPTVMLATLAAVNAIFITWATALDARHSSALARALGATPR